MIAWGFVILLKRDIKKILYATNYFLAGLFLFATLFGLIRLFGADNFISFELSGALGAFIALKLQQLIGFAGGFLLLFALIIALLVLSIDLDLQVTTEKLLNFFKSFSVWIKSLFSKNKSTEIKEVEVKRFEEPEIKKKKR